MNYTSLWWNRDTLVATCSTGLSRRPLTTACMAHALAPLPPSWAATNAFRARFAPNPKGQERKRQAHLTRVDDSVPGDSTMIGTPLQGLLPGCRRAASRARLRRSAFAPRRSKCASTALGGSCLAHVRRGSTSCELGDLDECGNRLLEEIATGIPPPRGSWRPGEECRGHGGPLHA